MKDPIALTTAFLEAANLSYESAGVRWYSREVGTGRPVDWTVDAKLAQVIDVVAGALDPIEIGEIVAGNLGIMRLNIALMLAFIKVKGGTVPEGW